MHSIGQTKMLLQLHRLIATATFNCSSSKMT